MAETVQQADLPHLLHTHITVLHTAMYQCFPREKGGRDLMCAQSVRDIISGGLVHVHIPFKV